jgi:hypothetical protein
MHIDAKLLAFLVEVAALEAKRFGCVRHVVMMALEFGEKRFSLERFDALRQSAAGAIGRRAAGSI